MPILGVNCKLYRLSTGSRATWNATTTDGAKVGAAPSSLDEVANCKDITLSVDDGEADVTTRGNASFEAVIGGLRKVSLDVQMVLDQADTDYQAFLKAYLTRGVIALAVLNGDKATAAVGGIWADFTVIKLEESQALGEAAMVTFSVKPTYSTVPPEWVKVSA